MKTYISILRGINVSGQKMIKMSALREMNENLGFSNVRTYIQSGNVVFETRLHDPGDLAKVISAAILKTFGFEVPVIVLEQDELAAVSEKNLFVNQRQEDISKLHVTFLAEPASDGQRANFDHDLYLPDEFYLDGKAIYLFCPNGYGNTKLNNNFFEKKMKVQATTRNWKTVLELVKLSEKF